MKACEQANSTEEYNEFSSQVKHQLSLLYDGKNPDKNKVENFLNGAAANALRQYVSPETRAIDGIFFSGKKLAQYAASLIGTAISKGATIADPACGAGDLLLACAERFTKDQITVKNWNDRLIGIDLHSSFIEAARARISLLHAQKISKIKVKSTLPHSTVSNFESIKQGDFFENISDVAKADCVVMNPPFAKVVVKGYSWASGSVQLAAVFLATVLENAKDGQEIVAILPDVLRSGSRYRRWRELVTYTSHIKKIHVYGKFDSSTDVDVFVLHIKKQLPSTDKKNKAMQLWSPSLNKKHNYNTVEDICKVSVGPYVPFRAKDEDDLVSYLSVKDALPDQEVAASDICRFNGTLHKTPFVVIRRTSSPSDPRRVIPTLITSPEYVAVENHLIILSPHDRSINTCKSLMADLNKSFVNDWINSTIRCRHLTTLAVKKIPLQAND